jgi:hypothetical protein
MIEKCICGHPRSLHFPEDSYFYARCDGCHDLYVKKHPLGYVHEFQLDNLKYVEDLAKERKLT